MLVQAGLDPTVINGGVINSIKNNAKLGKGDWSVVEADESDGSFLHLPVTYSVVTNIDHEHLQQKAVVFVLLIVIIFVLLNELVFLQFYSPQIQIFYPLQVQNFH